MVKWEEGEFERDMEGRDGEGGVTCGECEM